MSFFLDDLKVNPVLLSLAQDRKVGAIPMNSVHPILVMERIVKSILAILCSAFPTLLCSPSIRCSRCCPKQKAKACHQSYLSSLEGCHGKADADSEHNFSACVDIGYSDS